MAKLMTALIAAEELDSGKLSLNDVVTVSPTANAKQGTQIWLDIGEKIAVEELIKSITIGNANDGSRREIKRLGRSFCEAYEQACQAVENDKNCIFRLLRNKRKYSIYGS